jgi:filamentous hemagglutinin family protein
MALHGWLGRLGALAAAGVAWTTSGVALADVATDGTLGRKVKLTGRAVEVGAELGRVRGKNLFHSFERFDVATKGRVTFTGPGGLDNVVSRVTGGAPSSIDGMLASRVPGADVFLVNPSGIVFGPNARLDVPGSFHASTADELRFSDGVAFSAADPGRGGLSVARPEAFGFLGGGSRPGAIAVDRGVLEVPAGETLSLVAEDVTVTGVPDGTFAAGAVRAPDGRVAVTAVGGGAHAVGVGPGAPGGTPGDGRVLVTDQALVASLGQVGGAVAIRGGEIVVQNGSIVVSRNLGTADSRGGVALEAGSLTVDGSLVTVDAFDEGNAGSVSVAADRVEVRGGGLIRSGTDGGGNAGPVTVEAGRLLVVGGGAAAPTTLSLISSTVTTGATGDGGAVTVRAGEVELRDGAGISTDTFGSGDAGPILIEADRLVATGDFASRSLARVSSNATERGTGDGGAVTVRAGGVELRGGSQIDSGTDGSGRGGSITVEAGRLLVADTSRVAGIASKTSTGRGGSVRVEADEIEVRDSSSINSITLGTGDAGTVTVVADGRLLVAGNSTISSSTGGSDQSVTGAGGPVNVRVGELELRDNGLIQSDTFLGGGPAGAITVEADQLRLRSGGVSSSAILGTSPAGDVTIRVGRLLADDGRVQTEATGGIGGRIVVTADELVALRDSGVVSNGVSPAPGASVITVRAPLIALNDSRVTSLTGDGTPLAGSGEARLLGGTTIVSTDSLVAASSTVETTGLQTDLGTELQLAPGAFLDAGALLGEGCAARRGGRASSFTRAGRGGLPPSPDRPLASGDGDERGRVASAEGRRLLVAGTVLFAECDGRPLAGAM